MRASRACVLCAHEARSIRYMEIDGHLYRYRVCQFCAQSRALARQIPRVLRRRLAQAAAKDN